MNSRQVAGIYEDFGNIFRRPVIEIHNHINQWPHPQSHRMPDGALQRYLQLCTTCGKSWFSVMVLDLLM